MLRKENFRIEKCEDCLRVTRVDIPGDKHTHVKSRQMADKIITNVCLKQIPLHSHSRTLVSMMRLSDDEVYIRKIEELLETRKQKGKKQSYHNFRKRKKGK